MNLEELVFKVNTSDIERASKLVSELGDSLQTLDKKVVNTANKQSMAESRAARAAKDNAKARLDNAKAIDVEQKAEERKQKALEKTAASSEKAEKATKKQTQATSEANSVLERQNTILEFQVQGWSRGQASILASAKATGALTQEMKDLEGVLETQRKLMADPFDKSASGLKTLQREYRELSVSLQEYNKGSDLTAKQARDLARDRERIIVSMRSEGKSILEIQSALKAYGAEYAQAAASVNNFAAVEKANLQIKKDIASATRQVTQEDERMAAALNTANVSMNKAATDSMVKYETNLKKMGLTQDEFTKKLAVYKSQLAQVQAQEEQRSQQHLARALSPQMTDIAVSLYSGQAPLTVLLQQGGQIADLFRLSGVEAQNFGKAMRDAFSSMIPVMATVGKGMLDLVKFMTVDAVAGMVKFVGNATGASSAIEKMRYQLTLANMAGVPFIQTLLNIGKVAAGFSLAAITTAVGLLVAGLVGFGVAAVKAIKDSDALARAMFNADASFKATHGEVLTLSTAMAETTGGSASNFSKILGEMAKQGVLAADDIKIFGQTASDQMTYLGMSAEDVVKKYSEMAKSPVEGLQKLAESTGQVSLATLKYVSDLVKLGEEQKAQEKAMSELARVQGEKVGQMKENLSGFAKFVIETGTLISKFFNQVFDMMWKATDPTKKLEENLAGLRTEYARIYNMADKDFMGNRKQALSDLESAIKLAKQEYEVSLSKTRAIKDEADARANLAKDNAAAALVTKEYGTALQKARADEEKATNQVRNAEKNLADARKLGFMSADEEAIAVANISKLKEGEANARKKVQDTIDKENKKGAGAAARAAKIAAKEQDIYNDTLNKADGLTAQYNNTLAVFQKMRADGRLTEQAYVDVVNELILQQPFATKQAKDFAESQDFVNKYLDRGAGLGSDYTKAMTKVAELYAKLEGGDKTFTKDQLDSVTAAIQKLTPAAKAAEKAIDDVKKAYSKYSLEAQKSLDETKIENAQLDDRLELIGLTARQQELMAREQKARNALLKVDLDLSRKIKQINDDVKLKTDPAAQAKAIAEAEHAAAEERKKINREVAVQAAEDMDKELRKINEGISDSIVTALFEGGKAGSKKLRDLLINTLKQPVTLVVNAVVNTLLGSTVGSLLGFLGIGGGGGVAGGAGVVGSVYNLFSAGKTGYDLYTGQGMAGQAWNWAKGIFGYGNNAGAAAYGGSYAAPTGTGMVNVPGATQSSWVSSATDWLTGGGWVMAVPMIAAYLGGMFKEEKMVGQGLIGNLGGDMYGYQLMRESGGLFDGPDYRYVIAEKVIKDTKAEIEALKADTSYDTDPRYKGNGAALRDKKIQDLYRKLEYYERDYADAIEGSKGPIKAIQDAFTLMRESTAKQADILGLDGDSIRAMQVALGLDEIHPDTGGKGLQLTGLTQEEASAKIQQALAAANEELARSVLGSWEEVTRDVSKVIYEQVWVPDESDAGGHMQRIGKEYVETVTEQVFVMSEYVREGETAVQALTRLSGSLSGVNAMFDSLGLNLYETSLKGADMASSLVDLFGGMENMQQAVSSYYDQFYTSEEKKLNIERQLTKQFQEQNIALPKTREEFRKLVDSLDLTTEEGRKMYAFLMQVSPAFASITESTEDLARAAKELKKQISDIKFDLTNQLLRAQGNDQAAIDRERALRIEELRKLDPALAELQIQVWRTEDASKAAAQAEKDRAQAIQDAEKARNEAINKAMSALQKAVAAEKTALQERINAVQETITKLQALFDLLDKSIKTLYDQVDATARMSYLTARNIIAGAVATVKTGGSVSSVSGLDVAIEDAMAGLSADDYSTKVEYDRERLRLADELNTLKGTAKRELTNAEKQLDRLNEQVKKLDAIIEYWQMQIDIANGTYTAIVSVEQAVANMQAALSTSLNSLVGIFVSASGGTSSGSKGPALGGSKPGSGAYKPDNTPTKYLKDWYWGGNSWSREGVRDAKEEKRLDDLADIVRPTMGSGDVYGLFTQAAAAGYTLRDLQSVGRYLMPELADATLQDYIKMARSLGVDIPAYAGGGKYRGGLALVGEQGPELINFGGGGHVSTASQTSAMLQGSSQRVAILEGMVVQLVDKLNKIADNTETTAKILTNVTPDGDSMNTKAAEGF